MLRRPRTKLTQVAAEPRWLALLAGLTVAAAIANAALMSTSIGQQALVDQWERTALAFGQTVDDGRYEELQAASRYGVLYGVASAAINVPLVIVGAALVIRGVFGQPVRPAPEGGFRAVMAVVTSTGVILALRVIAAAPLAYMRETTASATSLGIWFPGFDEAAPVARLLGLIDLFAIWWLVVLATGVSVLYRRTATKLALTFAGGYAVVAAVLAAIMAGLGGS